MSFRFCRHLASSAEWGKYVPQDSSTTSTAYIVESYPDDYTTLWSMALTCLSCPSIVSSRQAPTAMQLLAESESRSHRLSSGRYIRQKTLHACRIQQCAILSQTSEHKTQHRENTVVDHICPQVFSIIRHAVAFVQHGPLPLAFHLERPNISTDTFIRCPVSVQSDSLHTP